jgi:hypothetical protein
MWGALSNERTGLSFTIAAGPRQRSHSRVRIPWDSRPYFTFSDSRLPFSSPPTIRRVTVEVFDSASTRETVSRLINSRFVLLKTPRHGQHRKHRLQQFFCCCVTQLSHGRRREHQFQVSSSCRVRNMCVATSVVYSVITKQRVCMLQYELESSWKEAVLA